MAKTDKRKSTGGKKSRRLRYVQTLPTLATIGNLVCGFSAIVLCMRAMFSAGQMREALEVIARQSMLMERLLPSYLAMAAWLIFLSMVFDALDGRLARWTRHTTDFGAQLDSLADIVSFGLVPPMLVIALLGRQLRDSDTLAVALLGDSLWGRFTWIAAAIYVACAALRLARFNVENEPVEQAHQTFRGLPSPGAAGTLACLVILHEHLFFFDQKSQIKDIAEQGGWHSSLIFWLLPILTLLLGLLMVSSFHYVHLVNKYLRRRHSFTVIVRYLIVVALTLLYPEVMVAVLVGGYALSGPAIWTWRRLGMRIKKPGLALESESADSQTEGTRHDA